LAAGIAASTAAAALAPDRHAALIEAQAAPGYHTTGRPGAMCALARRTGAGSSNPSVICSVALLTRRPSKRIIQNIASGERAAVDRQQRTRRQRGRGCRTGLLGQCPCTRHFKLASTISRHMRIGVIQSSGAL
jgi:hypothetical protein